MTHPNHFDQHPALIISGDDTDCSLGWQEILDRLTPQAGTCRIAIECYPGVDIDLLRRRLVAPLGPNVVLDSREAMLLASAVEAKFATMLGNDPVFGRMTPVRLNEFFDQKLIDDARRTAGNARGRVIAVGTGATLLMPDWDLLIYVNVTRWEIQQRQRQGIAPSLGLANAGASPALLYKRGYFLDWRVADQLRHELYAKVDLWIDGDVSETPAMLSRDTLRSALSQAARRPFCLVPFFDPGPWGGQWMRRHLDLPDGPANYAWCFNCVPEENALALQFGARVFQLPALMLVHEFPDALLGSRIVSQFGAEFPIRFDFLDTVEGGNLSLQVHPLQRYIQEYFGLAYTQDESYYILDAEPDATVFLGLREGINAQAMAAELGAAQDGGAPFCAEKYVNTWPAKKHDHFLIPAGTIHCSGRNSMVLEISATPYIFTFKLWDWGRLRMNGLPRPIHLEHGLRNIQWDRTTSWVRANLIDRQAPVASGEGWREERTGLHPLEFLETRRHWFTSPVHHDTHGNLNVLNLVEGDAAIVESPAGAFPPLTVHYAETFVIPASVGPYVICPANACTQPLATVKAYVREVA